MDDLYDEYVKLAPAYDGRDCANQAPRFGNFIGEEVESEESGREDEAAKYVYDDDEEASAAGQEVMDLDGT